MGAGGKLKVLSLFAGIGGFDLGLERTGGFETVAFCEFDKKAQAVLRKHWPEVPIYDDVRTLTAAQLAADGIAVDVICGGFPCQDISTAGRGEGIAEGTRSGLWFEFARLIGELRPRYVLVENVSALLGRGLDTVLGDLAALRYDAWWDCIPAAAVGAPHRRDRIWIVAHSQCDHARSRRADMAGVTGSSRGERREQATPSNCGGEVVADAPLMPPDGGNDNTGKRVGGKPIPQPRNDGGAGAVAHTLRPRLEGRSQAGNAGGKRAGIHELAERRADDIGGVWAVEPDVGRVAHGVPGRVDRLKQLGNAVVPQVVELIGRAILASLEQAEAA